MPLISEEKLETQNGIMNRRNVCQRSGFPDTLSNKATPMIALMPSELSQMAGDGSKCVATVARYHAR